MSQLLKAFKGLILQQHEQTQFKLIPYYETLNQIKDSSEFKKLEESFKESDVYLSYIEEDDDSFYEEGHLKFYDESNDVEYMIQFELGGMTGDYCMCQPSDEDYNYKHNCCGIHCDHYPHKVSITKTEKLINHQFKGYAKDLWELESNWLEEADKEKLEHEHQHRIYEVEMQIENLHIELNKLKNKYKNT